MRNYNFSAASTRMKEILILFVRQASLLGGGGVASVILFGFLL